MKADQYNQLIFLGETGWNGRNAQKPATLENEHDIGPVQMEISVMLSVLLQTHLNRKVANSIFAGANGLAGVIGEDAPPVAMMV